MRRYLDVPPWRPELAEVVARLGLEPWDIARDKEAREEGISLPREPGHRDAWLEALAAHPRALQAADDTGRTGPPSSAAIPSRCPGSSTRKGETGHSGRLV